LKANRREGSLVNSTAEKSDTSALSAFLQVHQSTFEKQNGNKNHQKAQNDQEKSSLKTLTSERGGPVCPVGVQICNGDA